MDTEKLITHTQHLIEKTRDYRKIQGVYSEVAEFLRSYAGPKSEFLASVKDYNPRTYGAETSARFISSVLESFLAYVQAGLLEDISPERKAQIDVVSDILGQAQSLLDSVNVHPVAPTVLIGAALEEFLRNWLESEAIALGNRKPSLDSYAKLLRENELITKQDAKDITSWSGLRNHAAHGEWELVEDKSRVSLMLEGVNLFMRKYGG